MNPDIYVTLCHHERERVDNYKRLIKQRDDIKKFHALEFKTEWELIYNFYLDFKIPAIHPMAKKKGKMARWATVIMAAKYVYDLKIEDHIIVMEDDVNITDKFDVLYNDWCDSNRWIKLSRWGELFALNYHSAKHFINALYNVGINRNNDKWIQMNTDLEFHNTQKTDQMQLLCKPNYGVIRHQSDNRLPNKDVKALCRIPCHNKTSGDKILLNEPLFTSREDINFSAILRRYNEKKH